MHVWTIERWEKFYCDTDNFYRKGLRVHIQKDVDLRVKDAVKDFSKWMRVNYYFPIRINIYIKSSKFIKAQDKTRVSATFFEPEDRYQEPYARIAVGDYYDMLEKYGPNSALAAILGSIAHELTHYYQWINNLLLTDMGRERQATMYSKYIVHEYAASKDDLIS
ncbi:hypothetical protein [Harryflintia acetispora]|uniref:hypothetical protein n=1 Tax=Harryflintia acetispora TaxID=1849041 RepID=UPI001898A98C|nr:hypothetical protein [Harryflintia acetispora]